MWKRLASLTIWKVGSSNLKQAGVQIKVEHRPQMFTTQGVEDGIKETIFARFGGYISKRKTFLSRLKRECLLETLLRLSCTEILLELARLKK